MIADFGLFGSVVSIGIIILLCFIALRIFKSILSFSFIGFVMSLISYFSYDYIFATVPVIAAIALVLSIVGFTKNNVLNKIFSIFGILISGYIILVNYGILG